MSKHTVITEMIWHTTQPMKEGFFVGSNREWNLTFFDVVNKAKSEIIKELLKKSSDHLEINSLEYSLAYPYDMIPFFHKTEIAMNMKDVFKKIYVQSEQHLGSDYVNISAKNKTVLIKIIKEPAPAVKQ